VCPPAPSQGQITWEATSTWISTIWPQTIFSQNDYSNGMIQSSGAQCTFIGAQFPCTPESEWIAVWGSTGSVRRGSGLTRCSIWERLGYPPSAADLLRQKAAHNDPVGCNGWRWPSTLPNSGFLGCFASCLPGILVFHAFILLSSYLFLFHFAHFLEVRIFISGSIFTQGKTFLGC